MATLDSGTFDIFPSKLLPLLMEPSEVADAGSLEFKDGVWAASRAASAGEEDKFLPKLAMV